MIRATISQVKNSLSAYLRKVRAGETVVIMDRKTPIATIKPLQQSGDQDARLERLHAAGVVVRAGSGSSLAVLPRALPRSNSVLEALLEERQAGR